MRCKPTNIEQSIVILNPRFLLNTANYNCTGRPFPCTIPPAQTILPTTLATGGSAAALPLPWSCRSACSCRRDKTERVRSRALHQRHEMDVRHPRQRPLSRFAAPFILFRLYSARVSAEGPSRDAHTDSHPPQQGPGTLCTSLCAVGTRKSFDAVSREEDRRETQPYCTQKILQHGKLA